MGRTIRRNDKYKKDRRDKNFQKSKKWKDLRGNPNGNHKPVDIPSTEPYDIDDITDDN